MSTHMRLIPNLLSYRPEVFTISAYLNILDLQLKMEAFIVFYDQKMTGVHKQSVRYIKGEVHPKIIF